MTGVDIPIQQLVDLFDKYLWTANDNDFNGRIYDNEDQNQGIRPELFLSGKEYKDKLLNDKVDSTVFFRVIDNDYEERLATVQIYFSVNLEKLYPTKTDRADEYAINDAIKLVKYSQFRTDSIVRGKPAFDDYFEADQNKHDMQPFYLFRIDTEVSYTYGACPADETQTFDLVLSSGDGGSTDPAEGTYTFNKGDVTAVYANVDTGYRFVKWVVNTIDIVKNPLSLVMNQIKNVVAEFIARFQLTTSVDGNGTVDIPSAIYDDGTSIDITATADVDNEFVKFTDNGVDKLDNPYTFVMDTARTVIAYFNALITAIQDVFGTTPITELGLNYWPDASGNDNKVQIKNTQVGYFAGDSWIGGDFTGYTISSQIGIGVASKTNDSRIDVTIGTIDSITITNGILTLTWYAQEGTGIDIYFTDQNQNVLECTFQGGTVSEFRGITSDVAYPALQAYGGSKELENEVAGTTSILAAPDGSNLGSENVVNGGFSDGVNDWDSLRGSILSAEDGKGKYIFNAVTFCGIGQTLTTEIGKTYQVIATKIKGNVRNNFRLGTSGAGGSEIASYFADGDEQIYHVFVATTTTVYLSSNLDVAGIAGDYGYLDNVSVKEVTAIPAYGEIEFTQETTLARQPSTYIFADETGYSATFNTYELRKDTDDRIRLYAIINGAYTLLFITDLNYIDTSNNNYQYKWQRNETLDQYFTGAANSIRVSIKGGAFSDWTVIDVTGGSGSNPVVNSAITEGKFLLEDNDAGDIISRISKDGQKYDLSNFIDGTGTYGVRNIIGVGGGLDAKGNALEFPANTVWNTGNTFDGIQIVGKEIDQTADDVLAIENSATVVITKDTDLRYVSNLEIS